MPYVIVTAHYDWAFRDSRERVALEVTNRWAERLDDLDGITNIRRPRRGGRIRHVRLASIGTRRPERLRANGPVDSAVSTALRNAALLAMGGESGCRMATG